MILAIDPSFSSTGVAIATDSGINVETFKVSRKGKCYSSIVENHQACSEIVTEILKKLECYQDKFDVIIEYPALATRSGAYLAILNGFLASHLQQNSKVKSITWVGPKHCDSFIKNKVHSKTYIVDYCKTKGWVDKKISHDECTALIFVQILLAIRKNMYKNSYFVWNR